MSEACTQVLWLCALCREGLAVRDFGEPNYVQCVTFDPKGEFIGECCTQTTVCHRCVSMCSVVTGVGFTGGVVRVLDALTLEDVCQPFHYARDCITHIAFSHDSSYLATAVSKLPSTHIVGRMVHLSPPLPQDLDLCVTVYVAQPGEETQQPWQFLAKHKAHYKQIQSEHGTA